MAQSQAEPSQGPTVNQMELMEELEEHLSRVNYNGDTGHVIAACYPEDNYYAAYRASEKYGYEINVFHSEPPCLNIAFR